MWSVSCLITATLSFTDFNSFRKKFSLTYKAIFPDLNPTAAVGTLSVTSLIIPLKKCA